MFGLGSKNETALLRVVILSLIALIAFSTRLFSVIRYESVIHEFDPWFNYRTTQRIVSTGFYDFINWFDDRSWYPLGRVVGGTVYPGLMLTAGVIHKFLHFFNIPIDIRNVCVFFAPIFSGLTAFSAYLFTKEVKDDTAGLFAAIFLGIAPGYISRSVAGSYDNEGISIFLLVFTFYLWIKAVKLGSAFWGCLTAIFYFYMVSAWGGYVYIINMIPLHGFALILMGRYSNRLYVAYSSFYVLGTIGSMQVPFVGFQPTRTSEHMAALGVFGLLQLVAFAQFLRSHIPEKQVKYLLFSSIAIIAGGAFSAMIALTYAGYIAPWTGRFYSLWDTEYAKKYIPIIASVSEHQPTAWSSMFFDLQYLLLLFPAGVYFCMRMLRDEHVFVAIYAITSAYFAGVMVRLVLTLTPIVCVTAAVTITHIFDFYLDWKSAPNAAETPSSSKATAAEDGPGHVSRFDSKIFVAGSMLCLSVLFVYHCTWVTSSSYSSPSIVLSSQTRSGDRIIIDDFREAYYWLRKNTHEDAKVLAWWDYGYQIAGMSNRSVIVDNNTWNNTHIATVGKVMASDEDTAYVELRRHDVDYVLVIFGGLLGYSGDDINKFLWMVRIAQGVYPNLVREENYFTSSGRYSVGDDAPAAFRNSVMYKLSYYGFNELSQGAAMDRVRNQAIASAPINLHTMEEAYTTANWMVRIYKVLPPDNLGRPLKEAAAFKAGRSQIPKLKRRKKRVVS
ncbi:oligosaccharyl transferase stt3 subunit [Entomophthora muscae]|uniref:Oligosaccharyl transferase stt3 subunit n=1 Tax=Entomophthora muscae TaxID=34485 RepID=A0ACC2U7U5_9FUNG|nr:oligosaccharyl transferase stt3 subunit [Entomophthora muscae]